VTKRTIGRWVCTVCGYVHEGVSPPEFCPICGAPRDLFKPLDTEQEIEIAAKPDHWRCLNCEYVQGGDGPPKICPVCGAPAERFEPHVAANAVRSGRGEAFQVVIVGGGIAGVAAAQAVRETSAAARIRLLSREKKPPYYRLNLTRYLAGEVEPADLPLRPQEWYGEKAIEMELGVTVTRIEPASRRVVVGKAATLAYDRLILAVGSHPFLPPLPGMALDNVTSLRFREDADFILDRIGRGGPCVIVGGGILGLETAGALARRGADVTLLEGYPWLLPRQLNEHAGLLLERLVKSLGIDLEKSVEVREVLGRSRVGALRLGSNRELPADLVVFATGVRPNTHTARTAGLEVNRGVVVSNLMATSHPDIWAAGDVTEHRGVVYGTWGPAQFQGAIAGRNAAGERTEFSGVPRSNMLKVLGIDLFSMGRFAREDASDRMVEGLKEQNYFHFLFQDNHLVGFILLGDTRLSAQAKGVVEEGRDCSPLLRANPTLDDVLGYLEEEAG